MLKKLLLTFGLVLATSALVFSQSGTLKGKITDKATKEPIPFANIVIELGGTQVGGSTSDFDGNYTIKPIPPGKYDVKATFVGYKPYLIKGVIINSDKITFYDLAMEATSTQLSEVEVVDYKVPLINKDQTQSGGTVTSEEIAKMPNRSASAIATTVGGVFSQDGSVGGIRGQRSEGTVMYIDGIKVRGSQSLPEASIDQVSVILGGVPAQYGDVTGGIINVTTKGPSRTFGAGIDAQSSEFLDAYGYNRVGINMQGPLLKSKDPNQPTSLLGYFIAAEVNYDKDSRPTFGIYKVKDDVLKNLEATPLLQKEGSSSLATYRHAETVYKNDIEKVDATMNTPSLEYNGSGKIDVRTGKNTNLTVGGSYNYNDSRVFSFYNSMFNWDNNQQQISSTARGFIKFTHRIPGDKDSKSFIKNIYYSLQADYTKYHFTYQDANHKDDLFKYGYIGKFERNIARSYGTESKLDTVANLTAYLHDGFKDISTTFTRSEINPILANYTSNYYSMGYPIEGYYDNREDIQNGGALLNGMSPDAVYSLWASPGTVTSGYGEQDATQYGFNFNASADLKNHAIQLGFQYEERDDRGYSYTPTQLWDVMYLSTNAHIEQLDLSNPHLKTLDGVFQDTIYYDRLYDASSQRTFDINLRKNLGLSVSGTDYIDINSYDFENQTINYYDADMKLHTVKLSKPLDVDMFSADELLNSGNQVVSYYGYDYTGKRLTSNPSFEDFYTQSTREIGAFKPVYIAGYIQDKFAFKDLIFNVGLRMDRFDANQMVLKDPYLLTGAKTVAEATDFTHPGNMGSDYIVYVNNANDPTSITGYRNGSTWYNAEGLEISDPESTLDVGNGVCPYVTNVEDFSEEWVKTVFKDYKPQINYMPRISFSFPISDEALFFAHYDVLTQRPGASVLRNDPTDYLFLDSRSSPTISNSNLKPSKTIDYELGFQQKLNNASSLVLSTYYREVRDQVQFYRYTGAYPKTYYSYNNIDFGTIKGLTVTYDLRRTQNARVRASYSLQFANGTGSDANTSQALVTSGQPNLRTPLPLSDDRRHSIQIMLDYRWDEGGKYNGPVIKRTVKGTDKVKTCQLLKNTGFNFTINGGSGTPYTKSSKIYPLGGSRVIEGSVNGSRLPWSFRLDGRVDRDINLNWGKNGTYLNVYLQVLNILNSKNILAVYDATGNADDDGYLADAEYQSQIAQQIDEQSYRTLYELRLLNPDNYSAPRQIRLGLSLNF